MLRVRPGASAPPGRATSGTTTTPEGQEAQAGDGMSERRDNDSHLMAIGRLLGSVDALERWLGSIKADVDSSIQVQDTRAQDDVPTEASQG